MKLILFFYSDFFADVIILIYLTRLGIRGRPSLGVRIVTVRRQTPSFSFHSPPLSSKMKSIPDYASLCTTTNDNDDDDSTSSNSDRSIYNIKNNNNNNTNNNNINLSVNHHIKKDLKNKMINENIENYYIINPDTTSFPKKRVKYESL